MLFDWSIDCCLCVDRQFNARSVWPSSMLPQMFVFFFLFDVVYLSIQIKSNQIKSIQFNSISFKTSWIGTRSERSSSKQTWQTRVCAMFPKCLFHRTKRWLITRSNHLHQIIFIILNFFPLLCLIIYPQPSCDPINLSNPHSSCPSNSSLTHIAYWSISNSICCYFHLFVRLLRLISSCSLSIIQLHDHSLSSITLYKSGSFN